MKFNLHKNIGYANMGTKFEMLEVKVLIIIFVTQGFS